MTVKVNIPFRYEITISGVREYEETEKGDLLLYLRAPGYARKHKIRFPRNQTERGFEYKIIKED